MRRHLLLLLLVTFAANAQQDRRGGPAEHIDDDDPFPDAPRPRPLSGKKPAGARTEPPVPAPPASASGAAGVTKTAASKPAATRTPPPVFRLDAQDWRFVDPAATVFGAVDLDGLSKAALARGILEQITSQLPQGATSYQAVIDKMAGANGVRRVFFSLRDTSGTSPLLVLTGKIDEKDLSRWTSRQKLQSRRLDAENILVGDPASILAAVGRLSVVARPDTALMKQGRALAAGSEVWLVASGAPLSKLGGASDKPKSIGLSLSLRDDLQLTASLEAATPAAAQNMLQEMSKAQAMLPDEAQLDPSAKGSIVSVRFKMPGERLKQLIGETIAARLTPEIKAAVAEAINPPKPAPRPMKATIYGLEEGTREVLLTHP